MNADPIRDVMPRVSRALKNGDRRRAFRLLSSTVGRETARRAMDAFDDEPGRAPSNTLLTPGEYASVWNAACGLTAGETAERFFRGTQTVMAHRKSALRKLGAPHVAAAVAECYRRGIFKTDTPLFPVDW